MIAIPPDMSLVTFPPPQPFLPFPGGIQFKDAAPMIAGVVDNGVSYDDPRVMVRLNEATKIIMDALIPVGGMMVVNIVAQDRFLVLPPQMENIIEVHPAINDSTAAYGKKDTTQGWYEIVNNSAYLDPASAMDNPLLDFGLNGNPSDTKDVRRIVLLPGDESHQCHASMHGRKALPAAH